MQGCACSMIYINVGVSVIKKLVLITCTLENLPFTIRVKFNFQNMTLKGMCYGVLWNTQVLVV